MVKYLASFNRLEEIIASLCMATLVIVVGLQVFNRYALNSSLVWTGELSRYLFIWAVFIGCAYATREGRHLSVTILYNLAPKWLKKTLLLVDDAITIVFCGFCVVWGGKMVQFLSQTGQEAPALEIPIYWVYLALPVGMLLMGMRVVRNAVQLIKNKPPVAEETDR